MEFVVFVLWLWSNSCSSGRQQLIIRVAKSKKWVFQRQLQWTERSNSCHLWAGGGGSDTLGSGFLNVSNSCWSNLQKEPAQKGPAGVILWLIPQLRLNRAALVWLRAGIWAHRGKRWAWDVSVSCRRVKLTSLADVCSVWDFSEESEPKLQVSLDPWIPRKPESAWISDSLYRKWSSRNLGVVSHCRPTFCSSIIRGDQFDQMWPHEFNSASSFSDWGSN